ncbi:hypothetical protein LBMAG20_18650 [Methylocystaceae bacterium]|nr:hypothetical protein LBMAG20_18650 [Methylocystaceae bacterium]
MQFKREIRRPSQAGGLADRGEANENFPTAKYHNPYSHKLIGLYERPGSTITLHWQCQLLVWETHIQRRLSNRRDYPETFQRY